MILTVGFTNALGVLFPVFMDSFKESRERTGQAACLLMLLMQLVPFFGLSREMSVLSTK